MIAIRNRISTAIKACGDTFTVGASSRTGIFAILSRHRAESYLTDAEVAAASDPIYSAVVPHDDATTVGSSVVWNGVTLTVKRALDYRIKNTTIGRLLVLV